MTCSGIRDTGNKKLLILTIIGNTGMCCTAENHVANFSTIGDITAPSSYVL
jgi:hypothetical protein